MYGRDLPDITREFKAVGVRFANLYERLDVPLDWLDWKTLRRKAWAGLQHVMGAYGREPDPLSLERTLKAWINDEHIDFGRLDEDMQERIIRHLLDSPTDRSALKPQALTMTDAEEATLVGNRSAVEKVFSLQRYGQQLMEIYHLLLDATATSPESLDSGVILDSYLAPENLFLLRS